MGHRYYDPGTGRFLTRDPLGYGGGMNLYGYADGNPVNESDPDGYKPGGATMQRPPTLPRGPLSAPKLGRPVRVPRSGGLGRAFLIITLALHPYPTADSSTGPGSPYYNQQRDRWLKKRAKELLSGENIEVGSIRDADDLLRTALPNAKKSPGAGPIEPGESPDFSQFKGTNPNGMYHKDYLVDPETGRIYGHNAENAHGGYKHINIKLPGGKKVFIKITPR